MQNQYPSKSVASLFSGSHLQEKPIHAGQPCCVCAESDGELEHIGFDEVLGELWIHEHCKQVVRDQLKKAQAEINEQYERTIHGLGLS